MAQSSVFLHLAPGCCPDDPVAPEFRTLDELLVLFWFFLYREVVAAAAETMPLKLVAAVRAAIATNENFMLVVVV